MLRRSNSDSYEEKGGEDDLSSYSDESFHEGHIEDDLQIASFLEDRRTQFVENKTQYREIVEKPRVLSSEKSPVTKTGPNPKSSKSSVQHSSDEVSEDDSDDMDEKELRKMTVPQLKAKCKKRALTVSGNKTQLIDRLLNKEEVKTPKRKNEELISTKTTKKVSFI